MKPPAMGAMIPGEVCYLCATHTNLHELANKMVLCTTCIVRFEIDVPARQKKLTPAEQATAHLDSFFGPSKTRKFPQFPQISWT